MTAPVRTPVVEVVRRRGPRPVEPPSAPLPPAVTAVLAAIVRDMRDVPRDCLRDPAELFIWLRRMADRVEGVGRMRVPGAVAGKSPLTAAKFPVVARVPPASPRDLAEAVFGKGPSSTRAPEPRTIVSRRGRAVKVETRRAKAAGQFEMSV